MSYKPLHYPTLSVYLMSRDAQGLLDFIHATFPADDLRRTERPDGSIAHAEVRIDDSVVMVAQATPDYPPVTAWLHVYVSDVDETYRRALAAGATSVEAPTQKANDEDRRAGVADAFGNTWWIATQVG